MVRPGGGVVADSGEGGEEGEEEGQEEGQEEGEGEGGGRLGKGEHLDEHVGGVAEAAATVDIWGETLKQSEL
jgi:hypothetical protein